ncbi:MAG: terminase family protein [Syntrophobacter sp.]
MTKGRAKILPADPSRGFLEFQRRWIDDTSRLKLMEKSRQIGISWGTAYGAVERTAPAGARFDQWVSSRDEIQAKLFLEDCLKFARTLDAAAQNLGSVVIDPEKKLSAYVLQFANGQRIHSMSSNPDAQAGKRGGRILDEFALHPDPRKLYSIAYPGITWGGQMEIVSTHRGSANYFNELVQDIRHRGNPKKFSHHRVTLQDALDQGFLYKLQGVLPADDPIREMDEADYFTFIRSGCADEEQFQQEYMCVPADDEGAFLTYDQIARCEYSDTDEWEMRSDGTGPDGRPLGDLYLGVDVGRNHDLTVMWVLERLFNRYFTRKIIELRNTRFAGQRAELYALMDLPNVRRGCVDATGLGMQLAEEAREKYGFRIEPVRFTAPVKEALAYPLREAFADQTIRIPRRNEIRSDLRAIRKTVTAAGNIRFDADRGTNGHSDRFWAQALALHAAGTPGGPPEHETVSERRFAAQKGAY